MRNFTHPNIEQNEDNTKSTKISNNNLNNADNHVHNINNKQTCASPCFDLYQQTWSLPSRFYSLHIHFIHPKILKLNRIINSVLQIISKTPQNKESVNFAYFLHIITYNHLSPSFYHNIPSVRILSAGEYHVTYFE